MSWDINSKERAIAEFSRYLNKVKRAIRTGDKDKLIEAKESLDMANNILTDTLRNKYPLDYLQYMSVERRFNNIKMKYQETVERAENESY